MPIPKTRTNVSPSWALWDSGLALGGNKNDDKRGATTILNVSENKDHKTSNKSRSNQNSSNNQHETNGSDATPSKGKYDDARNNNDDDDDDDEIDFLDEIAPFFYEHGGGYGNGEEEEEEVTAEVTAPAILGLKNMNDNEPPPPPPQQQQQQQHEQHYPTLPNDSNLNVDPLHRHNENLIRPRPRNLRLVFIGDSITRYQYLSMAYWLRYGRWFDPTIYPNNLVNAHSFHHTYHPDEDWNEFFLQSNRMLQPLELCDCVRREKSLVAIERRYFRDKTLNNTLVYINVSGKSTLGHGGLYGRVNPKTIFFENQQEQSSFQSGLLPESINSKQKNDEWEFATWSDLIRFHIGPMNLGPTAVALLNAGLHPNRFHDSLTAVALEVALEDVGIRGMWKTTTYTKDQLLAGRRRRRRRTENWIHPMDEIMCFTLSDCFNLSWMVQINPQWYYDQFHFNEPIYRILNEDLLDKIGLLPKNYKRLDRSILF